MIGPMKDRGIAIWKRLPHNPKELNKGQIRWKQKGSHLSYFNTGWCKADLGTYIFFKGPGGEKIEIPVLCFLVDTGDHKIMVDTWMSSTEWATKYHHDARKGDCMNSPGAIRKLGFVLEEVDLCFTDNSYCGVCRTSGANKLSWMRLNPHMIDPWKFQRLDAVCVTH